MPRKPNPLLCELHAHTTWSDGDLTVRELCDLYGRHGFDVLAVTDHTTRIGTEVTAGVYDRYLAESPHGAYASQALGRKMMLVYQARGAEAARSLAVDYLERFPSGAYAATAKKLAAESAP